jgi:hypothetical protein
VEGTIGTPPAVETSRLSGWSIVAGLLFALALLGLLETLGAAIFATSFSPTPTAAKGLGIGFGVWSLLALCICAFAGAWLADGVAGVVTRRRGLQNGLVVWSLFAIVLMWAIGGATAAAISNLTINAQTAAQQRQAASAAANVTALGSWGLFVILALTLLAALVGGALGASSEMRRRLRGRPGEPIERRGYVPPTPPTPSPA